MSTPDRWLSEQAESVVGREAELTRIQRFVDAEDPRALLLVGDPGIGKTVLWEAALGRAHLGGSEVLSARASETDVALSFSVLADLFEGIDPVDLLALPAPQRQALEVSLHRATPAGDPPDPFAISLGFLGALRSMAEHAPVVIGIDDLQWLDRSSLQVVLFVAHRVADERIRFVLARRSEHASPVEDALRHARMERVEVSGLSVGALSRVLSTRLEGTISRRILLQLHAGAVGNPLIAIELGRLYLEGRLPQVAGRLQLPARSGDLFDLRIQALPAPTRKVLLSASLGTGFKHSELASTLDPLELADAIAEGLVVVDGGDIRAAHPLLAAAVQRGSTAAERRAIHQMLAAATRDPIRHAQHLSIATEGPSTGAAAVAEQAADLATGSGQVWDAVALSEHALRLTVPGDADYDRRLLRLARAYRTAGDFKAMTVLLEPAIDTLVSGRNRAMAHLLLCDAWNLPLDQVEQRIATALDEAGQDPEIHAWALTKRAEQMFDRMERLEEALEWATEAVATPTPARVEALTFTVWTSLLLGHPPADVPELRAETSGCRVIRSVERVEAVRSAARGEVHEARRRYDRLLELAEERGELDSIASTKVQQCELELRAGHLHKLSEMLRDCEGALLDAQVPAAGGRSYIARLRAVRGAVAGDTEEAERWAEVVLGQATAGVNPESPGWDRLESRRALGLVALLRQDAQGAVDQLSRVWAHGERERIDEPGAFPVAGDLTEALLWSGRTDEARAVATRLRALAERQDHPWALATARRAEAQLQIVEHPDAGDEAWDELTSVARAYAELGLDFDSARTLMTLGVLQRRRRRRAAARASLAKAIEIFDACGCAGWAARSREELERVSGRRRTEGGALTAAEARVARLAASGLSNNEIAAELFVTVNTVEGHLSHVYAKLGIRSRTQLAGRLR